jgi:hypothetical protein
VSDNARTGTWGIVSRSLIGSRGLVSLRGEDDSDLEDGDLEDPECHRLTGRSMMKQAGKRESKSIVSIVPKPTRSVAVDRRESSMDDFSVQASSSDRTPIPNSCLFESLKLLLGMSRVGGGGG